MTVPQIASRLVELCKSNEFLQAQKELFAEDAISIEPHAMPGFDKETHGLKNINDKIEKFMQGVEESYGNEVSGPLIAGNSFAITMAMDVKMLGQERMKMAEVCVYETRDGKIISERFFF